MRYKFGGRRFRIDHLIALSALALAFGCGGGSLPPVMPAGGAPASLSDARAWAQEMKAGALLLHRFRWQYRDRDGAGGGRGSARITPGDSLRLDMIGPLGAGRGAAFIIGDQQQWAEPEEEVKKVAPNYPLLWAMLGIPWTPEEFDQVSRYQDPQVTAWRFVHGADTVEIARLAGPPLRLMADVREGGVRLGKVITEFTADGALKSSRLDVPRVQARLQLNYYATIRPTGFPPETWRPPEP
jgi:hypothetical protein